MNDSPQQDSPIQADSQVSGPSASVPGGQSSSGDGFRLLSRRILHLANTAGPGLEFEREVGRHWLEASRADAIEFRLDPGFGRASCRVRREGSHSLRFELLAANPGEAAAAESDSAALTAADADRADILAEYPLFAGRRRVGQVTLRGGREPLSGDEDDSHRGVAEMVALALLNRRAQWALRERVKELTCLYGISRLTEQEGLSLEELLRRIVELIPPGWQYPEITQARLLVDGRAYPTLGYRAAADRQTAEIVLAGELRGRVEVVYTEARPVMDEGPFLREERHLIDAIATSLALILEKRRAEEDRVRLEEQLRHADRLATIGQLAAGVAHELNEPLGAILGFAQLARQAAGLTDQAARDIDKILAAALNARDVVRKLMLFARQTPPRLVRFSLNELLDEGLVFLESRCVASGVVLKRVTDPELPLITADRGQIQQVLVNLTVNAIQAMPEGGTLTLRTEQADGEVRLVVEDTGVGMADEVRRQIFVPFFTTKDVGQGTGLGLSVVHGIVSAHGGSIEVESRLGSGSRFEIRLPLGPASTEGRVGGEP